MSGTSHAAAKRSSISKKVSQVGEVARKLPGEWAKEGSQYDCSSFIGPLFNMHDKEPPAWPMYSFDRPSYIVWNAIARELNARDWTDEEIRIWLQSKNPRWALDGILGDMLGNIGALYASRCTKVGAER